MKSKKVRSIKKEKKYSDRKIAFFLFCLTSLLMAIALPSFGISWDEPRGYFQGAFRFLDWLKSPTEVSKYWPLLTKDTIQFNAFYYHPPLTRVLGALTWSLFHFFFDTVISLRLASVFLMSGTVSFLYLLVSKQTDQLTGLIAAIFLITMPRVLGQGFILTSDVTLLFTWILGSWIYLRNRQKKNGFWLIGCSFGLLILAKFTGLIWMIPIFIYDLVKERRIRYLFFLKIGLIGLGVAVLLNPTWWGNPIGNFWNHHILLSMSRNSLIPFTTSYFGNVGVPPFHYPFVMMLVTMPLVQLIFMIFGLVHFFKQKKTSPLLNFCLAQSLVLLLIFSLPSAPKFDGVRLYLVIFPWFAILAAVGLNQFISKVKKVKPKTIYVCVLLISLISPLKSHPFEFSYYSTLVGGAQGAAKLGFEATYFWEAVTPKFCKKLNSILPENASIQVYPPYPDHFSYLQFEDYLRKDLVFNSEAGDYILIMNRGGVFTPQVKNFFENETPLQTVTFEGVPLISLFRINKS